MNRTDLQKFSQMRLREAKALLKARQYSGAYYLAGYSVECALKACICKYLDTRRFVYPEEVDFKRKKEDYWSHSFLTLVKTADLETNLNTEENNNPAFSQNWVLVKSWRETSRYETHTNQEAQALIDAIENPTDGVLQWLKKYW